MVENHRRSAPSQYHHTQLCYFCFFTFTDGTAGEKNYSKKASHSHHASLCMNVCPFSMVCAYGDKVTGKKEEREKNSLIS